MLRLWYNLVQVGGPSYPVEFGRLNGLSSTAASVNGKLPKANQNLDQLNAIFADNGLNQTEMIALSGNMKTKMIKISDSKMGSAQVQ